MVFREMLFCDAQAAFHVGFLSVETQSNLLAVRKATSFIGLSRECFNSAMQFLR